MLSEEYNFWSPTYNQLICPSLLVFFFFMETKGNRTRSICTIHHVQAKIKKQKKKNRMGQPWKGGLPVFLCPIACGMNYVSQCPWPPPHHLPFYLFVFLVQPLCPFLKVPSISRVWFPGKWEDNHNLWDLNKLKIFTQLGLIMQLCDFAGCA